MFYERAPERRAAGWQQQPKNSCSNGERIVQQSKVNVEQRSAKNNNATQIMAVDHKRQKNVALRKNGTDVQKQDADTWTYGAEESEKNEYTGCRLTNGLDSLANITLRPMARSAREPSYRGGQHSSTTDNGNSVVKRIEHPFFKKLIMIIDIKNGHVYLLNYFFCNFILSFLMVLCMTCMYNIAF